MFRGLPVIALLALACAACGGRPDAVAPVAAAGPGEAAALRGERLATTTCARCHAVGPSGASPLPAATPFRELVHRYPLDRLEQALEEGLVTTHPAMPRFVFRAGEIDDLVAWLERVQAQETAPPA
ncbi:MAG: cytochrome c [Brevundimonas sp.]|uniref:c-type cytochrome n=1 Tax=Brevundimonas sp. TaxID=1871086 RepID=UPI00181B99E8|nr:cytochrome c [Brevundimonas sp.]MBA4803064.1 cytochrome c [Brevundimonas sp.]